LSLIKKSRKRTNSIGRDVVQACASIQEYFVRIYVVRACISPCCF
jgi:hypothetical protein